MEQEHIPTPWGTSWSGGVRCSCPWSSTGDRLKDGWKQFRRHYEAQCTPLAPVAAGDDVTQASIYDYLAPK